MSTNVNLAAYAGIEKLSNFTPESLDAYRKTRMERYHAHVDFLRSRAHDKMVKVLEIGSGSSALLYALVRGGVIAEGMGVELSTSRHEFAQRWKADDGFQEITNVCANFIEVDAGAERWDWFVVIDNTFTYLHPEDTSYPAHLLTMAHRALKPDGRLLLDFINYANRVPGKEYTLRSDYLPGDPFLYGLYSNRVTNGVNDSVSVFVKRDGTEDRKIEKSKVYPIAELTELLVQCGFRVDETYADFRGTPYAEATSERLLVVARKTPNSPARLP